VKPEHKELWVKIDFCGTAGERNGEGEKREGEKKWVEKGR